MLQRAPSPAGNTAQSNLAPPIVHEVLRSPGQPLDTQTRAFMEPRFGHHFSRVQVETSNAELTVGAAGDVHEQEAERAAGALDRGTEVPASSNVPLSSADFSQVRVHTDSKAAESAHSVGARAYTVGNHIIFGDGQYAPGTRAGRNLLAHELTHVMQQNSGKVSRKIQRAKIPYRQVTWDDYQGGPPAASTFAAETSSGFDIPAWSPKVDITDIKEECKLGTVKDTKRTARVWVNPTVFDKVAPYMDQGKSWVRSKFKDPDRFCKNLIPECEAEIRKQTASTSKDCKKYIKPCQDSFDTGSTSYAIKSGSNKIEVKNKAECATKLVSECEKMAAKTFLYEQKEADTGTTIVSASSTADCSSQKFGDDCRKYYRDWSAKLLKHEQGHFDISNVMANKARADLKLKAATFSATGTGCGRVQANNSAVNSFNALNAPAGLSRRGQDWLDLKNKAHTDYDDQTNHGLKLPEQSTWEKKIAAGLTAYDLNKPTAPAQAPVRTLPPVPSQTPAPSPTPANPGSSPAIVLQRAASNCAKVTAVPPIVHEVLRSPGQPLDAQTRAFMEPRFGHDFGNVRVHTDAKASESAKAVNAHAYTSGTNLVFDAGKYAPQSAAGQRLLAHELTHVIQQGEQTSQDDLAIGPESDSHEREAETVARAVATGEATSVVGSHTAAVHGALQRSPTPDAGLETPAPVSHEELTDDESEVHDGDSPVNATPDVNAKSTESVGAESPTAHSKAPQGPANANTPASTHSAAPKKIVRIDVDQAAQMMTLFWSDGTKEGPRHVSTGRGKPNTQKDPCDTQKEENCTPNGTFGICTLGNASTKNKHGDKMSWYVGLDCARGIGIHNSQPVPGVPASHGCVRVGNTAADDAFAKRINNNVVPGKTVINISGKAPTKPWKKAALGHGAKKTKLQRKVADAGAADRSVGPSETQHAPPIVQDVLRSPGQPLDAKTGAFMEPRFGHDFGRVRVHAGVVRQRAGGNAAIQRKQTDEAPGVDTRITRIQSLIDRFDNARDPNLRAKISGTVLSEVELLIADNRTDPRLKTALKSQLDAIKKSAADKRRTKVKQAGAAAAILDASLGGPLDIPADVVLGVILVGVIVVAYAGSKPDPSRVRDALDKIRDLLSKPVSEDRSKSDANTRTIVDAVPESGKCRFPTGLTKGDPIPIQWFKLPDLYPSPIILGGHEYERDDPTVLPDGYPIGVPKARWPKFGKLLQLMPDGQDPGVRDNFRKKLRSYGFHWGGKRYLQADHVQDPQWGDENAEPLDTPSNLWPYDGAANASAGPSQNNSQPVSYCETPVGRERVDVPISSLKRRGGWGRWFMITTPISQ